MQFLQRWNKNLSQRYTCSCQSINQSITFCFYSPKTVSLRGLYILFLTEYIVTSDGTNNNTWPAFKIQPSIFTYLNWCIFSNGFILFLFLRFKRSTINSTSNCTHGCKIKPNHYFCSPSVKCIPDKVVIKEVKRRFISLSVTKTFIYFL